MNTSNTPVDTDGDFICDTIDTDIDGDGADKDDDDLPYDSSKQTFTECDDDQYEVSSPNNRTDRVCAYLTNCTDAQSQVNNLTGFEDRECEDILICNDMQYKNLTEEKCVYLTNCTDTQYQTNNLTGFEDRNCEKLSVCNYTIEYEIPPDLTRNRVCIELTECNTTEFEKVFPNNVKDRECQAWATCEIGFHESEAPDGYNDRICTASHCNATRVSTDYGDNGNYYCVYGIIEGTTGNCSCTCASAFSGTHCDICAAGYGVDDDNCVECEYPQANQFITTTAGCLNQTCADGYGVVTDGFNTSSDASQNCEKCASNEVSEFGSGVCQLDTDGDRRPDIDDDDDDGDGYLDVHESQLCSPHSNHLDNKSIPEDTDGDKLCDTIDPDIDGDLYNNTDDDLPYDNRTHVFTKCDDDQYEVSSPTNRTDRVCKNLTVCNYTIHYEIPPNKTRDRTCKHLKTCSTLQYETITATTNSDRGCEDLTTCNYTIQYEIPQNATSNRVCKNLTECDAGYYEKSPPTAASDRVCEVKTCVATYNINDGGIYGYFYCRHGKVRGTSRSCNCTCVGGFTGRNCDLCRAGYGYENGECKECSNFKANNETSHEAPCLDYICPEGFGIVEDYNNTLHYTDSNNCEPCNTGYISPGGSAVCQRDTDGDGEPDIEDDDDDGDGYSDDDELSNCGSPTDPKDIDSKPADDDNDGICNEREGTVCDTTDPYEYILYQCCSRTCD